MRKHRGLLEWRARHRTPSFTPPPNWLGKAGDNPPFPGASPGALRGETASEARGCPQDRVSQPRAAPAPAACAPRPRPRALLSHRPKAPLSPRPAQHRGAPCPVRARTEGAAARAAPHPTSPSGAPAPGSLAASLGPAHPRGPRDSAWRAPPPAHAVWEHPWRRRRPRSAGARGLPCCVTTWSLLLPPPPAHRPPGCPRRVRIPRAGRAAQGSVGGFPSAERVGDQDGVPCHRGPTSARHPSPLAFVVPKTPRPENPSPLLALPYLCLRCVESCNLRIQVHLR